MRVTEQSRPPSWWTDSMREIALYNPQRNQGGQKSKHLERSTRMRFPSLVIVAVTIAWTWTSAHAGAPSPTGDIGPGLEPLDQVMFETLRERRIPGATLVIAKDGRLVLARGYGLADVAAGEAVTPQMLFNLASCTKAFEGVAVLKLVVE